MCFMICKDHSKVGKHLHSERRGAARFSQSRTHGLMCCLHLFGSRFPSITLTDFLIPTTHSSFPSCTFFLALSISPSKPKDHSWTFYTTNIRPPSVSLLERERQSSWHTQITGGFSFWKISWTIYDQEPWLSSPTSEIYACPKMEKNYKYKVVHNSSI